MTLCCSKPCARSIATLALQSSGYTGAIVLALQTSRLLRLSRAASASLNVSLRASLCDRYTFAKSYTQFQFHENKKATTVTNILGASAIHCNKHEASNVHYNELKSILS